MNKIKKLTKETLDFIGMTNDREIRSKFIRSQLKQAYLKGKTDGLEKAREIYKGGE